MFKKRVKNVTFVDFKNKRKRVFMKRLMNTKVIWGIIVLDFALLIAALVIIYLVKS